MGLLTETLSGARGGSGSAGGGSSGGTTGGTTGSAASGSAKGASEKQIDTVRTMQGLMAKLRDELQTKAETVFSKIKAGTFAAAKDLSVEARSFGSTSAGGTTGTQDGIWGANTKKALQAIQSFIEKAGISGVIINPGTGTSPHKEMKDEDVIQAAQDNITNIARLFVELGLDVPAEASRQGGAAYVLDQVDDSLNDMMIGQDPWPTYWGKRPVTIGDLRDLLTFYYLIQGLKYTDCQPLEAREDRKKKRSSISDYDLESLAQEVLSNTLFSLAAGGPEGGVATSKSPGVPAEVGAGSSAGAAATSAVGAAGKAVQDVANDLPGAPAAAAAGPSRSGGEGPMAAGGDGPCFSSIGHFIWWFSQRARSVYAQMLTLRREARPHPIYTKRAVVDSDIQAATAYMAAMRNIATQWAQLMPRVENVLRDRGWEQKPIVNLQVLLEAMESGGAGGGGAARRRGGERGSSAGYTVEGDMEDRALRGPIRDYMPLENMLAEDSFNAQSSDALRNMSSGSELPNIDLRTWRTGSWTDIATRYIDAPTQTEQLRMFPEWASLVRRVIQEIFQNWQRDNRGKYDEQILRQQDRLLSEWEQWIRSKISQSQQYMDREVARIGGNTRGRLSSRR